MENLETHPGKVLTQRKFMKFIRDSRIFFCEKKMRIHHRSHEVEL